MSPMYALNLYFHSSNVAQSPLYVGGLGFSLCVVANASASVVARASGG